MDQEILKKYSNVEQCPVRHILDRFGDKWSTLVLLSLDEFGTLRFNEIHKSLHTISQKMLSTTLKKLEADDLLSRKVYPEVPPRVEYTLTPRGKSLVPHLHNLVQWAVENFEDITLNRQQHKAS